MKKMNNKIMVIMFYCFVIITMYSCDIFFDCSKISFRSPYYDALMHYTYCINNPDRYEKVSWWGNWLGDRIVINFYDNKEFKYTRIAIKKEDVYYRRELRELLHYYTYNKLTGEIFFNKKK